MARKLGLGFAELSNGFASCEDVALLQRICHQFGPGGGTVPKYFRNQLTPPRGEPILLASADLIRCRPKSPRRDLVLRPHDDRAQKIPRCAVESRRVNGGYHRQLGGGARQHPTAWPTSQLRREQFQPFSRQSFVSANNSGNHE